MTPMSPGTGQHFAPFQFFQQRNAVEKETVQKVSHIPRGIFIVHKFHCIHQRVRLRLNGVGQVGIGNDKQRKRNFIPHLTGFQYDVRIAESREPETFLKSCLRIMIRIVSTQHSFGGHCMRQRKYRSIQRYRKTVPLCLKELLIRSITQFKFQFTGRNTFYKRLIFILPDERNEMRRFIFPQTCSHLKGEARMKLVRIRQFRFPLIADTVVLLAFQRQENVILTGIEIMLPILVDIGQITEFQRVNRKLIGILFFLMERIFQFRQPFHTFVAETVRHISPAEQMRIKPCRCHSTGTHTHSFQRITADGGVHHADIEQRSFLLRCGNISGKQHLQHLLRPIINRITTQLRHHLVYGSELPL